MAERVGCKKLRTDDVNRADKLIENYGDNYYNVKEFLGRLKMF